MVVSSREAGTGKISFRGYPSLLNVSFLDP